MSEQAKKPNTRPYGLGERERERELELHYCEITSLSLYLVEESHSIELLDLSRRLENIVEYRRKFHFWFVQFGRLYSPTEEKPQNKALFTWSCTAGAPREMGRIPGISRNGARMVAIPGLKVLLYGCSV